jgi:hypothetical protein
MMKYRKRPVVIEAVQLRWDTWSEICDFVDDSYFDQGVYVNLNGTYEKTNIPSESDPRIGLLIKTLEGTMLAVQDDYVIKGVSGEFYPCKPDIFEQTYELVGE